MKRHTARGQSHFWAVAAILVFALAFGGGGSKYGMANLLVQLAALVALAFHGRAFLDFWKTAPLPLKALVAASMLLPMAYIVPLPREMWEALPGRDLVARSFELLGDDAAGAWASASVEPMRTLLALTALITPLALLAIGWSTPRERLVTVGWVLAAFGLLNLLIGIPQVLSNGATGVLYPEIPMPGVMFGTFANRNSTGLFLVAALAMAALLPTPAKFGRAAPGIRIALCALLVLGIILTRSRTALVLALVPLGLAALRYIFARMGARAAAAGTPARSGWVVLAPVVLAIAMIGAVSVAAPGRVGDVIERFEGAEDNPRAYIWDDAIYVAGRYWPVGSGTGTFDDVFQVDESLENITLRRAGRAHNDYIEVAIEAGLPGLALIVLWLVLLAWYAWRARTSPDRWVAWSGAAVLLTVAAQSITDYPLRNQSLLAGSALALLMLVRFGSDEREPLA
ncbi:MAG: O-antigen ligase family protein [Erythrobacter sp.]